MDQQVQGAQAPLKYADRLAQSKDQKDESTRQLRVEEAKLDIQSAILVQKNAVLGATRRLEEAMNESPLDLKKVISLKTELRDLNAGMQDLNDLNTELF